MTARYCIHVGDQAGEYHTEYVDTPTKARNLLMIFRDRWPDKVVSAHDMERDGRCIDDELEDPDAE
jgi:hypothetical protein